MTIMYQSVFGGGGGGGGGVDMGSGIHIQCHVLVQGINILYLGVVVAGQAHP